MPNSAFKIATRLYFSEQAEHRQSKPAVRVALAGMIVGVMVMILTICIVVGFKQTVTAKVAGFGAHIQVVSFDNNNTYDLQPIEVSDSMLTQLASFPHVVQVAPFITKTGMIKTNSAFQGIVLKGTDYWSFFERNLMEGVLPVEPNEVLISRIMANRLQLGVGQYVLAYFVDGTDYRARRFKIVGLYDTGFAQNDELFVVTTLSTARPLLSTFNSQLLSTFNSKLSTNIFSGVEVLIDDFAYLDQVADDIYFATVRRMDENGYNVYFVQTLQDQNPAIFAWLDLLDMNVIVIIILMLLVAGFNIVSGLIILILDGVQLIGTLKALGADNRFVRRIFLIQASWLIAKGVLWGNIIGLALVTLQYFTHLMPLDPATYYVSFVPVVFPWGWLLLLNMLTIGLSLLILLLPSMIISHISPAKVMHFE